MSKKSRKFQPVQFSFRVFLLALYAIPILWIILTSLKSAGDILDSHHLFFFKPTIDAYKTALGNSGFVPAIFQSAIIATGTTFLTLLLAIPAGYALARVNGIISSVVLATLIILQMTPQTASIIPLFKLLNDWKLLDNTVGVIFADTALLTPFAILLMRPFFRTIPIVLEEAAAIDGAGSWLTFRKIALPLSFNGAATTATLIFLITWGEFLYSINFFLTPGKYPSSALLAEQVSAYGINWSGLMCLAVITSIPILILFLMTYKLLKNGLTLGAVK